MKDFLYRSEKIREFRVGKEMTQPEFAEKVGVSKGYIAQIETGTRKVNFKFLEKLQVAFDMSNDQVANLVYEGLAVQKEFTAYIEMVDQERQMIEQTEGPQYVENFVPIPIAKGKISGGPPRVVREDPDGVAIIYKDWAQNRENFTAVWMVGKSMEKTIPDGSLVGIDHSQKDIRELDGKIVAIRKENEATIKRLRIISKKLVLGLPDNPDYMKEVISLTGEQINNAIIGKVVWWWGRQE